MLCNVDIDDCASHPCQNGGQCTDGLNSFKCTCASGYTGTQCDVDIDECSSGPCENLGTCIDQINAFKCLCETGFTGNNCQTDVDDCSNVRCQNGGTCKDGINEFVCLCSVGFTGNYYSINSITSLQLYLNLPSNVNRIHLLIDISTTFSRNGEQTINNNIQNNVQQTKAQQTFKLN